MHLNDGLDHVCYFKVLVIHHLHYNHYNACAKYVRNTHVAQSLSIYTC